MTDNTEAVKNRFMKKVRKSRSGCWLWTAGKTSAYGAFHLNGKQLRAHRVAYELFVGPIPANMVLHHTCERGGCVNPAHLVPMTAGDNLRLQDHPESRKTHCPQGHPYNTKNTYVDPRGHRHCRVCKRENQLFARGYFAISRPEDRTHCPRGHPYNKANTIIRKDGSRLCRECNRETCRAYRDRRKRLGTLPKGK
jgi:hypothetical protein